MQESDISLSPPHEWSEIESSSIDFGLEDPATGHQVVATEEDSGSLVRHRQAVEADGYTTAIDIDVGLLSAPPYPAVRKKIDELEDAPELVGLAVERRDDDDAIDFFVVNAAGCRDQLLEDLSTALEARHEDTSADGFAITGHDDDLASVSLDVHPRRLSDVISDE